MADLRKRSEKLRELYEKLRKRDEKLAQLLGADYIRVALGYAIPSESINLMDGSLFFEDDSSLPNPGYYRTPNGRIAWVGWSLFGEKCFMQNHHLDIT